MKRVAKAKSTMVMNRRTALTGLLAGGTASCATTPQLTPFQAGLGPISGVFASGIASGDPQTDRMILWTRISDDEGNTLAGVHEVRWEVSKDKKFSTLAANGTATTSPAQDGTIKIDASGLEAGQSYYYRFIRGDSTSPTGKTRTLPAGAIDKARFAIVSCSNYPFGYFNVYDQIARNEGLDAVLHLGDYLYEYGNDGYGGSTGKDLDRNHYPSHEILTLSDYRRRHRQYKSDPSAQAMHAAHPMIAIWDDHETANNSWKDGAQNHSPETEGEWETRRRAALQAYYEWMPVRDPEPGRAREAFFRSFSYGNLLTIGAIETRLMARSPELSYTEVARSVKSPEDLENFITSRLNDPDRQMLGATQEAWLEEMLSSSVKAGQPWRLIANQVIMGRTTAPDLTPHVTEEEIIALEAQWDQARAFIQASTLGLPSNFDAWDGYPAARQRFYELVERATDGDSGMIVVTGDTHTWWANNLTTDKEENIGVELGVHSVTSPSPYDKSFLGGKGAEYALLTNQKNKDVRYLNGENHGYIELEITPSKAIARYIAIDTITSPEYNAFEKAAFTISKRGGTARFSGSDGLSLKEGFLF